MMFNIDGLIKELRQHNRSLQDLLIGIGDLLAASQEERRYSQARDNWEDIKRSVREDREE